LLTYSLYCQEGEWLHMPHAGSDDCSNTFVCQGSLTMVAVPPDLYSVWNFMDDAEVLRDTFPYDFLSRFLNILSGIFPSSSHLVLFSTKAVMLNLLGAAFLMPSFIIGRFSLDHFRPLMVLKC